MKLVVLPIVINESDFGTAFWAFVQEFEINCKKNIWAFFGVFGEKLFYFEKRVSLP